MAASILFFLAPALIWAAQWECRPGGLRKTLERADNGDTLWLNEGIYREGPVVIQKNVVLLGRGNAVLDGQYGGEIMTVAADGVIIRRLVLQNTGTAHLEDRAGLKVVGAEGVHISDCLFIQCYFAVYLAKARRCTIERNVVEGRFREEFNAGNGIHAWKSEALRITDNRINGQRDGIYFEFVTDSEIRGNVSSNNIRYGLHFMFSHDDVYADNHFEGNGAGCAVMYSKRVQMLGNVFVQHHGPSSYAILLKDMSDGAISGNCFLHNTSALFVEGSSRMLITDNVFDNNGWALRIQASCESNKVDANDFFNNTFDVSTNGNVVENTFSQNYWDKYEGYDLNRDGVGDVAYRPVSLFSRLIEQTPHTAIFVGSFLHWMLDRLEKAFPESIPHKLIDTHPVLYPHYGRNCCIEKKVRTKTGA